MPLECFRYDTTLIALEQVVQSFSRNFVLISVWMDSLADVLRSNITVVLCIKHQPFDFCSKLTNIAGPEVGFKNLDRFRSDSRNLSFILPRVMADEM